MHIGFIGLGNMGAPMALNVLRTFGTVTVYDKDRARCLPLEKAGARVADDVRALCTQAEVVLTSLPGPKEIGMVVEQGRLVESLRPESVWIDMSTGGPDLVRRLEAQVRSRGATMLDAPVTGAVDGAKRGKLVIFVGGDATAFAQQEPVLRSMGTAIHCGVIGSGNVVKLVTNQLWFINAAAIGEALVLGVRGGVDAICLWNAIRQSVGTSFVVEHDVPSIFAGHYDPSFSLDLCLKDLDLIRKLSETTQVPIQVTLAARAAFESAKLRYGGDKGELHVAKLIEDATGTTLRREGNWVAPWEVDT